MDEGLVFLDECLCVCVGKGGGLEMGNKEGKGDGVMGLYCIEGNHHSFIGSHHAFIKVALSFVVFFFFFVVYQSDFFVYHSSCH